MGRGGNKHGPSVEKGLVLRTSVSAMTAFDPESYGGCPRRWWWTRVAGVKEEETVAQKAGTDGHSQNEAYLKTGADVLGPIAQAGKHLLPRPGDDLVIEGQFGDLGAAVEIRRVLASIDSNVVQATSAQRAKLRAALVKAAGLCANDIPFDGYIDVRHARGEYVDVTGLVQKERSEHGRVVEVIDHKFTSSIQNFAKSPSEMASTIQMVGYANYVLNTDPTVDNVRLSHLYFQTRGPKLAKKVTAMISARKARDEWRRVDKLAVYKEEVARAQRVEDIEPQIKSCDAYRGCPHVSRCPITRTLGKSKGGTGMSLFNTVPNTNANGAAQPSAPAKSQGSLFGSLLKGEPKSDDTSAGPKCVVCGKPSVRQVQSAAGVFLLCGSCEAPDKRAAVEAEKVRLQAEDRGENVPPRVGVMQGAKIAVTACLIDKNYLVDCGDGKKPRLMKFAGAAKGLYVFVDTDGSRVKLEVVDDVVEVVESAGVLPPDAPQSTAPSNAAPLKPEQIERIEDPEVKQRAQEHARQVAAQTAQVTQDTSVSAQPAVEKTSGRCSRGGADVLLTDDNLAEQIVACALCGKEWKLKDANPAKKNGDWFATLPNHNIKTRAQTTQAPQAAQAPQVVQVQQSAPQAVTARMIDKNYLVDCGDGKKPQLMNFAGVAKDVFVDAPQVVQAPQVAQAQQSASQQAQMNGIVIFIDVAVERGAALTPLDMYYGPIVRELEKEHDAADIRCAPQESALSFGKWKGALAATVRATPPPPGIYSANGSSEVAQVVVEALAPSCSAVLRGMRG